MDLNRVILIGRLTRDPELRLLPSGDAKTMFTLAVHRPPAKDGNRQTDFIDCVAWRQHAQALAEHAHKGETLAVEGRLNVSIYSGANGESRKAVEVTLTDFSFLRASHTETDEREQVNRRNGSARHTPAAYSKATITTRATGQSGHRS